MSTPKKKTKRKRTTNLSRTSKRAKIIKLIRRNEAPEVKKARNQKIMENRRKKLAAETPEEQASRRRHEARVHKEVLNRKRQEAKRMRVKQVIESIRKKQNTDEPGSDDVEDFPNNILEVTIKEEPNQIEFMTDKADAVNILDSNE